MKPVRIALLGALLAVCADLSRAQESEPYKPAFDQVIPKPSGKNGYEELVMAADLATSNVALNTLQESNSPTLTAIRKVLDQPELVRARALLRMGLQKPVGSPREKIDDETILPELRGFRQVARMLSYQIYVDFADGRINRAIDNLRDCLRFGYVVQTDSLISGLVGIAIDGIGIRRFEEHLDQLSAADCDRLLGMVREWLKLPDPAIGVLNAERQGMASMLRKYRSDPDKLISMLSADPQSEEYKKAESVRSAFRNNPQSTGAILDQAGARMSAHFDRLLAEARKAQWERQDLPPMEDDTPAGKLCRLMGNSALGSQVMDKYAYELARVQMLGLWAAVRRYWWENLTLPASLETLGLGPLAIDPFTGKPFRYKAVSTRDFELGSIGPLDRAKDSPTAGQRQAVAFPAKK